MNEDEMEEHEGDINEERQGLGQEMVAEEGELAGNDTGGGGASGASAPGVRRRGNNQGGLDEEGEEGREAKIIPTPIGPPREARGKHNLTHTHTVQSMVSSLCQSKRTKHASLYGEI